MPKALTMQEKIERGNARTASYKDKISEQVSSLETKTEVVREEHQRVNPEQTRRTRGAFNGTTSKLAVGHTIPGFHLHWLNDIAGRIDEAINTGYQFVTAEEVGTAVDPDSPDKVRRLVGTEENGKGLFAYLMKQRLDWYEEDQAALQERNDIVDNAIRRGANAKDVTGFYVPREGVNYKTR